MKYKLRIAKNKFWIYISQVWHFFFFELQGEKLIVKKINILEGLRDTEDWINDAENLALHHMNKLHSTIY